MRADAPNLDVLRSLAVLFVVYSHLPIEYIWFGQLGRAIGILGVAIFFVHTCLVLLLSLERQTAINGPSGRTLFFLIRRAFRIYPLSIVVVLTVHSILRIYSGNAPSTGTTVTNLFLVQNLTGHDSVPRPLWSLPFEVQMYLFLPALYLFVEWSGKNAARNLAVLWLAAVFLVLVFIKLSWNYHIIRWIPCFLGGVLAFALRGSSRTLSPWVVFLYISGVAVVFPWAVSHGIKQNFAVWPICLMLGLIIPLCQELQSTWLEKAGKIIARYSYGVYLVHNPCIDFAFGHLHGYSPEIQWIIFVSATAALSYIAFHVIEKPFIEIGRKIVERWVANNKAPSVKTSHV